MSQLEEYLHNSSPISRLQQGNKIPLRQLHNSVDLKMGLLRQNPKNYGMTKSHVSHSSRKFPNYASGCVSPSIKQYSQMKASSIIYNIPELSPPQINFQISDHLRQKINQIKQDIVTKLPAIKSSQYNSNKLQSFLSRRTVLKDLQTWLQQKLKSPPLTHEESIQYKNMIMGVGMKEVIRLIGTRCAEQANIVNQIWELTWSICRQIILYLSNRAHKCEKILYEETSFFRKQCENRIKQCQASVVGIKKQNIQLKQRSDKLAYHISNVKKKNKELKLIKMNLQANFEDLKQQFEIIFKQNLYLHLKMAPNDQARRQWVKRKYLTFLNSRGRNDAMFKKFIQNFLQENQFIFDKEQLSQLDLVCDLNRFKQKEQKRKLEIQKQLQQKFRCFDKQMQTDEIEIQNRFIQTDKIRVLEAEVSTDILDLCQIGINTQQIVKDQKNKQTNKKLKKLSYTKKQTLKSKFKHKIQNIDETTKRSIQLQISKQQSQLQSSFVNQSKQKYLIDLDSNRLNSIEQNRQSIYKPSKSVNHQSKRSIKFVQDTKKVQNNLQIRNSSPENFTTQREEHFRTQRNLSLNQKNQKQNTKISLKRIEDKGSSSYIQKNKQQQIIKQLKSQIKLQKKKIESLSSLINNNMQRKQKCISLMNELSNNEKVDTSIEDMEILQLVRQGKIQSLIKIIKDKSKHIAHTQGDQLQEDAENSNEKTYSSRALSGKKPITFEYNKKIVTTNHELKKLSERLIFDEGDDKVNEKQTIKNLNTLESNKGSYRDANFKYGTSKILNKMKSERTIPNLAGYKFTEVCTKLLFESINYEGMKFNSYGQLQKKNMVRQQYRQCYRLATEVKSLQKNQKNMRLMIERSINSLFKQLNKEMINAQKQGLERMQQLKIGYNTLPIILTNRFNLNFGVKKVASKHVKDLLVCLNGIKKFTDRYALISYFLNNNKTGNFMCLQKRSSQLLFFFVLITSTKDMLLSQRSIQLEEIQYIAELAKLYLTKDQKLILSILEYSKNVQIQNGGNFFQFCKKFIMKYEQLYEERSLEMGHIYKALCCRNRQGKQGIPYSHFIQFVSPFYQINNHQSILAQKQENQRQRWQLTVINSMVSILNEQRISDGFIGRQIFDKFVFKCPQFNERNIQNLIDPVIVLGLDQLNIEGKQIQEKLLKIAENNRFLQQIVEYLFQSKSLMQNQMQFWLKYIKLYTIQQHIQQIMGSLLTGALDPKNSLLILENPNKVNK